MPPGTDATIPRRRTPMLRWAVIFFIIAIIAAVFGFGGVANDTAYIAKILAVVGIILAIISFISHRRTLP